MRVYLAGPMTGLTYDEAVGWRTWMAEELREASGGRIECYSPLRGKSYLSRSSVIKDAYREEILGTDRAIVARDRNDVRRSDVVVVNLLNGAEVVSIGTVGELAWCDAFSVPAIVVMKRPNIHDHAFIRVFSSFMVETLEDARDLVLMMDKTGGGA